MADQRKWETRILGNTKLEPTTMGIGGAWIGYLGQGNVDERIGADTVLRGLESGMNFIDTSGMYLGGRSEQFIGVALEEWFSRGNKREDLIICSKTGTRVRPHDYTYDFTMKSVETSLKAIGVDFLNIMLVHDPRDLDPVFADDGALVALQRLKEEGVIGAIGLGCRPHEHHRRCIESGDFEVSLTFKDFNLLYQTAYDAVIQPAYVKGVGVINASIMVNGFLGGADPLGTTRERAKRHGSARDDLVERSSALWQWCQDRKVDLGTLNLHYCLKEKKIASTVIGFSRPERVDQNVAAYFAAIDDDIWTELYDEFDLIHTGE